METNVWFWVGFVAFVLAMLALDLGVFQRQSHEVRPKEAALWTAIWVALALIFAAGLSWLESPSVAVTFLTGYVIEESLSIDNIFVIVLIFEYFAVPKTYQHRVLFYGILGALVMRGTFIGVGAWLITRFAWVAYLFGMMLVVTGIRMAFKRDQQFDAERNPVVKAVRRWVPLTERYEGKHFFSRRNGRRLATPLLLVLVLVEFTDLVFAVDSIPAIFGVTTNAFIVFTSNIFAVLGLRSLYFLLAAVVDRFYLLKYGLAVILTFVGSKMIAAGFGLQVGIGLSLAIILGILALAIGTSLLWPDHDAEPPSGTIKGKTASIFGAGKKSR